MRLAALLLAALALAGCGGGGGGADDPGEFVKTLIGDLGVVDYAAYMTGVCPSQG